MSSISFELCIYPNSNGFKFKETTGRQPDNPDGYPAGQDLSDYTGELTFVDKNDTTVVSENPLVTDDFEYQLFDTSVIPDGVYEVTYKVLDDGNALINECLQTAIIDLSYRKTVATQLAEANKCQKCRQSIIKTLHNAKGYYEAAYTLAKAGDVTGAQTAWAESERILSLLTCKC